MTSIESEPETPNIFREGDLIVMPIRGAIFPKRCVRSGVEVDANTVPLQLKFIKAHTADRYVLAGVKAIGGVTGWLAARGAIAAANVTKTQCLVGMHESLLTPLRKPRRLGFWLLVPGLVLVAIYVLHFVVELANPRIQKTVNLTPLDIFWLVTMGIGAVLSIVGGIILAAEPPHSLTYRKNDSQRVWIAGACAGFLESLPEYQNLDGSPAAIHAT